MENKVNWRLRHKRFVDSIAGYGYEVLSASEMFISEEAS